jgi:hypothetical protein
LAPGWPEPLGSVVEVVDEELAAVLVSLTSADSSVSCAAVTVDSSLSTAEVSEELSKVASTWPPVTCWPTATATLATCPATWNESCAVFTVWSVPVAARVSSTFPIAAEAVR